MKDVDILFTQEPTQLGSGHSFQSAFCGLWFQRQFHFQSLCNEFQISPACDPPRGPLWDWVAVDTRVPFSKPLICGLGWDSGVEVQMGANPEFLKQLDGIPFQAPQPPWSFPGPGAPFQASSQTLPCCTLPEMVPEPKAKQCREECFFKYVQECTEELKNPSITIGSQYVMSKIDKLRNSSKAQYLGSNVNTVTHS